MRILITAGPTREPIDPVRFVSNRSSGKMGLALAEAALSRGHEVCVIAGPVCLEFPAPAEVVDVITAEEMLEAVRLRLTWCDVLIMSAAVADWKPSSVSTEKIKKQGSGLDMRFERTVDILHSVKDRKDDRVFIGFSADTDNREAEALRKLRDKGLDLVVANDIVTPGSGFGTDTNQVTLFGPDAFAKDLPLMPKREVAEIIIEWAEGRAGQLA